MSLTLRLSKPFRLNGLLQQTITVKHTVPSRNAAGGGAKKGKASPTRIKYPVEKDPHKLVNYCCGSNYFLEGEDVKLGEDSDYPEWLFTMDMTRPKPNSWDMEPGTIEYYERIRFEKLQKNRVLSKKGLLGMKATK